MNSNRYLGVDIGKNWFHIVGLDDHGKVVFRKKTDRAHLIPTITQLQATVIGMEACSGSHYFAARLTEVGHIVRLIPGQFVKPYRKAQKNDFNDAEAIAEAVSRGNMRFSRVRSREELELQAFHRARERVVREAVGQSNQIRAFLLEAGIAVPKSDLALGNRVAELLEREDPKISPRLRRLLQILWTRSKEIKGTQRALNAELQIVAKESDSCRRLLTIPGVGVVTATALVSAVGDAKQFRRGRDLAAWIGLVPRQLSTGGKAKLLGISKGGNPYLRRLLVHGARSTLAWGKLRDSRMLRWFKELCARVHPNVAVVALANKLARVSWAILTKEEIYSPA
jgi:transposase